MSPVKATRRRRGYARAQGSCAGVCRRNLVGRRAESAAPLSETPMNYSLGNLVLGLISVGIVASVVIHMSLR
jgi:hypothetical protein